MVYARMQMKPFQLPLVLLIMVLICMKPTEGMGRWSKCFGSPPSDSFKAPDGKIVAWSPEDERPGRADSSSSSCVAYFGRNKEYKRDQSGSFFVLR